MNIIFELNTQKSLEEAVESLKDSLSKVNFTTICELNFKDILKKKGMTFKNDFVVLEICNGARAKDVLENNLLVGYLLPCKAVVYEPEEGGIKIGILKPTAMMSLLSDPHLSDIANAVENDLIKAVKDSI